MIHLLYVICFVCGRLFRSNRERYMRLKESPTEPFVMILHLLQKTHNLCPQLVLSNFIVISIVIFMPSRFHSFIHIYSENFILDHQFHIKRSNGISAGSVDIVHCGRRHQNTKSAKRNLITCGCKKQKKNENYFVELCW